MRVVFLLTTLIWIATSHVAMAGSVDAPFVHVDWWGGRVHVCAPFVDLYVDRPCCCARPACGDEYSRNDSSGVACACHGGTSAAAVGFFRRAVERCVGAIQDRRVVAAFFGRCTGRTIGSRSSCITSTPADAAKLKTVLENFDSAAADRLSTA